MGLVPRLAGNMRVRVVHGDEVHVPRQQSLSSDSRRATSEQMADPSLSSTEMDGSVPQASRSSDSSMVGTRGSSTGLTPAAVEKIRGLPDDWIIMGSTECCPVHGLYQPGRVLTFQGHFEFSQEISRITIREVFENSLGDELEGVLKMFEGEDDHGVIADIVVAFLEGKMGGKSGMGDGLGQMQSIVEEGRVEEGKLGMSIQVLEVAVAA